jgi:hypothetical protein
VTKARVRILIFVIEQNGGGTEMLERLGRACFLRLFLWRLAATCFLVSLGACNKVINEPIRGDLLGENVLFVSYH